MANAPRMFGGFFGGGGGNGQTGGGNGDGSQGQNQGSGDEQQPSDVRTGGAGAQGEEEENLDSLIGSIFGPADDEGDEENQDGNQQNQQQQQPNNQNQQQNQNNQQQNQDPGARLAAEINATIKGLKVGEEMIPENFDPSDPKQLRDLLGNVQQQGVLTAIQLAMKPMQMAMESQMTQMRQMVQQAISDGIGGFDSQQTLRKIVPEVDDQNLGPMVKTMHETALKKMSPEKAAQTVRKALDAMGLKKGGGQSGGGDAFTGGFRQGSSALDSFLPAMQTRK